MLGCRGERALDVAVSDRVLRCVAYAPNTRRPSAASGPGRAAQEARFASGPPHSQGETEADAHAEPAAVRDPEAPPNSAGGGRGNGDGTSRDNLVNNIFDDIDEDRWSVGGADAAQ